MRRLLLIRHAKSSWNNDEVDDHERCLSQRGERDSLAMARALADNDEQLDVLYSSTATRALDFAQSISDFTGFNLVPELTFYTFDADELLEILRCLPEHASRVGVVAHNPAITRLVNRLTGAELKNVPTASVAAISCAVEQWREIGEIEGECTLDYLLTPKMLK